MLPVFEELNGLLFYPLEYEGEEASYNIFYGSSVPDNKAIPAVEYLMSKDGGEVKRFVLEGTDYVYPRTSNKIIRAFLKTKGVKDEDIMENYTPFGFSDWQTEVAAIKKFGSAGKKTAVISTINGDANVPFYKELGNQGVKATDIPVIAFSVGEEELAGSTPSRWSGISRPGATSSRSTRRRTRPSSPSGAPTPRTPSASPTIRWSRPTSCSTCGCRRCSRPARPTSMPFVRR